MEDAAMLEHLMHLLFAAGVVAGVIALQEGVKAVCRRFLCGQCPVSF